MRLKTLDAEATYFQKNNANLTLLFDFQAFFSNKISYSFVCLLIFCSLNINFPDDTAQCHKRYSKKLPLWGKLSAIKKDIVEIFARHSSLSLINHPTTYLCKKDYTFANILFKIRLLPTKHSVVQVSGEWPTYDFNLDHSLFLIIMTYFDQNTTKWTWKPISKSKFDT